MKRNSPRRTRAVVVPSCCSASIERTARSAEEATSIAANCAACHTTADRGIFDEHDLRVPR